MDGSHYKALNNNDMAKCKQNPSSEGGREGAQDIQDVNVQGEGDCSLRNAYQSWYEVKRKANTQKCVKKYQACKPSKNTLHESIQSKVVKGKITLQWPKNVIINYATFNFHQANIKRGFHKLYSKKNSSIAKFQSKLHFLVNIK